MSAAAGPSVYGPCGAWDPIWCCTSPLSAAAAAVTGTAVAMATEILWSLSGRRFGACEVTLRPCRRDCHGASPWPTPAPTSSPPAPGGWWDTGWAGGYGWPYPARYGDTWINVVCGSCPGTCSCTALEETILPNPVQRVVQVLVDGAPLVTGSYRLDDLHRLVRTDGGRWPTCQDLSRPDTQVGTWSVTAVIGEDVPVAGQMAVGELACEISRFCAREDCQLPRPVQHLVRQGVEMTFLDPNQVFADGRVGLYFCDLFIGAVNPSGLRAPPQVFDVDGPRPRITGT